MNVTWALQKLHEYRDLLDSYEKIRKRGRRVGYDEDLNGLTVELDRRFGNVQAIIDAVRPGMGGSAIGQPISNGYRNLGAAIIAVDVAIGEYETAAERAENMRPTAPHLAADQLHPWVWEPARTLWATGHYRQAIQAAATVVNAKVQDLVGRRDLSDGNLMRQAFSSEPPKPADPPKPAERRLRWPGDPSDLTVRAMNDGIRNVSQGLFSAVRNPATHSTDEVPQQEALEQLAALSVLSRWIGQCVLVTAEPAV